MSIRASAVSHDMDLLKTAYEIGRYIQEYVATDASPDGRKPWASCDSFQYGPNVLFHQTQEGLVLDASPGGIPASIHTPYGKWSILDSYSGEFDPVMQAIQGPLGLKLLEKTPGKKGPLYAITRWKAQTLKEPVYRGWGDRMPYQIVEEAWRKFVSTHE
jgi:hypothetical protein